MDLISTPLISYRNIKVKDIDIIEDAFGLNSEFKDVIDELRLVRAVPGRCLTRNLMIRIRKTV